VYRGVMDANDDTSPSDKKEAHLLLIWERAIETQMHFAELSIKTRQIGMTVVGATLGLAIVLNRSDTGFMLTLYGMNIPITSVLCWTSALILFAIKILDVSVYHQMLRGAVAFNEELEERNLLALFGTEKGLTQAISFFSRHPDARYTGGTYSRKNEGKRHFAGNRISLFYWLMIGALIVAGLALKYAGVK
jgi:hypothetical protein